MAFDPIQQAVSGVKQMVKTLQKRVLAFWFRVSHAAGQVIIAKPRFALNKRLNFQQIPTENTYRGNNTYFLLKTKLSFLPKPRSRCFSS
jgi:hypothetical protein